MRPLHRSSALFAVVFGALALPADAIGQATGSVLEITVQSAEDLRPLAGARVIVEGIGINAITNPNGFARITGMPIGTRRVEVRYLGHETTVEYLSFEAGVRTRAQFQLPIEPIQLTEVRVEAISDILATRGFYERMRAGHGTFLNREDINRTRPRFLSDILRRMAGFQVGSDLVRPRAQIRGNGRGCPIQYYLDGTLTQGFNIDEVVPNDVEGLEIYRGAATLPPEYNKGTSPCGVILIWTRVD